MRIKTQDEILDQSKRAKIIEEIKGTENQWRKHEAYKRYQCFKDNTKRYVVENMLSQFDISTVIEMRYSISNISISKKIIDKLSKVYSNGCVRQIMEDDQATQNMTDVAKALEFNTQMKSANRFLKLQRNLGLYLKPCPTEDGKWTIKIQPLNPYLYDVVEDYYDRTKSLCHILSHYRPQNNVLLSVESGFSNAQSRLATEGNQRDETIADKPIDEGAGEQETFIWWSDKYHFTTDSHGAIIPQGTNSGTDNPIGIDAVVDISIDQDGSFWAEGGSDITDGSILLNSMLTHVNHVGVTQGYGQAFMTGNSLPRNIKIGPTKMILGEYKKDEQDRPEFDFKSANPQLDSMRGLVEAYLALLLTTNNLSTNGISAQLSGATHAASGVALIIDKAESLEDVQDQRQIFIDKEPKIWQVISNIINVYGPNMIDELKGLSLPDGFEDKFNIKFYDPTPVMTEAEKLANMKLRQDLGLDSLITLLMKDDPSLDEKQAEAKLLKIMEQKMMIMAKEHEAQSKLGINMVDNSANPQNGGNVADNAGQKNNNNSQGNG